ncbi:MAG: hypothetical protein EBS66_10750 [Betaproteobacteria bacterium]|nr:hypothetical protein [Betaproteobacteria bacterium]
MSEVLDPNALNTGQLKQLDYVTTYLTAGKKLEISRKFGDWASKPGIYIPVSYADVGKGLGLANNNGISYISAQDVAALTMMRNENQLTGVQNSAFDTLFVTLGMSSKSGDAYKNWQSQSNFLHMRDVVNNAMGDVSDRIGVTAVPTSTPGTLSNYVTAYPYKAATGGAIMDNWTSAQNRSYDSVDAFMQYWPTFDNAGIQNEIIKAINSGWTAKQIESALYDPKGPSGALSQTVKAFQRDFPALVAAHQTGKAINVQTPAQYQQAVTDYQTVMAQYGMPKLDAKTTAAMITNNITPQTLTQRAQLATEAYQNAPQAVKDMLEKQWGLSPGQAAHYILDPVNGYQRIKDQMASASMQVRGASAGINADQGNKLAALVDNPFSGVSQEAANRAVDQANALRDLQKQSYGINNQTTASSENVLGAAIGGYGTDQLGAQQQVEQAQQERAQASKAGGQLLTDQSGMKGAGYAQ